MDNTNLYSSLCLLGPLYRLKLEFDPLVTENELKEFSDDWKQYNPRKDGFNRWGLSLTSLDGSMNGVPDLDSINEYGQLNNKSYSEMDFRTPTKAFKSCGSLHNAFEPILPDLGRTHFIKFGKGGFFPPHRDAYNLPPDSFRIMAIVSGYEDDYAFILDEKKYSLRRGVFYFFNSMLAHSFFSFRNDVTILVLNVNVTKNAVTSVLRNVIPT